MKKYLGLFYALMVIAMTSGCSNTFNGAGKDIENMGGWMQDTF